MIEALALLAVAGNGVAVGVFMGTVLGGVPLLLVLPAERYVQAHGFLATRYDPFMPITLAATAVIDLISGASAGTVASRVLFTAAAVTIASVMVVSLTKTVPINRWVTSLDPTHVPPDWERHDPRRRWRTWNLVRTVLAVTGLLINLAAAGSLI